MKNRSDADKAVQNLNRTELKVKGVPFNMDFFTHIFKLCQ